MEEQQQEHQTLIKEVQEEQLLEVLVLVASFHNLLLLNCVRSLWTSILGTPRISVRNMSWVMKLGEAISVTLALPESAKAISKDNPLLSKSFPKPRFQFLLLLVAHPLSLSLSLNISHQSLLFFMS
jgi:hypothetical protein